jgi:hypothetical protein
MVLSETRTSIETELDQIFRILSVEEIVKAIELTFYKQLKDKFKKLTSGHLIWVNQDSFDLAISKIGKLPFEKKSNIRFCEEKNELSFLIEEVVGLFSNLEILDLFDETMIQSNISHYSPRERDNSMWPEVVAQKYIDLSEVSAAIDAEENKEGDFGQLWAVLRDGNHRTWGAILSGEEYVFVRPLFYNQRELDNSGYKDKLI